MAPSPRSPRTVSPNTPTEAPIRRGIARARYGANAGFSRTVEDGFVAQFVEQRSGDGLVSPLFLRAHFAAPAAYPARVRGRGGAVMDRAARRRSRLGVLGGVPEF